MGTMEAVERLREVVKRKHLALATERSYCGWLRRYCDHVKGLGREMKSEEKVERFLTVLAKEGVAASTQNQAFNALLFFYKEVLGRELKEVQGLRARRPVRVRHAPSREETLRLLKWVHEEAGFSTALAVRLLYGCGLRVTEPLNLRIKDVDLESGMLMIREAKGGKERAVSIPCAVQNDLREQMEGARVVWKRDQLNKVPVALPHQLAVKYPQGGFEWKWAWVFPAAEPCRDPRSGARVRWRLHEANIQRAVRKACRKTGCYILPHELRHAYATHCLNRGSNPRAIQEIMGHKSLETTMAYLHADVLSVPSPLD